MLLEVTPEVVFDDLDNDGTPDVVRAGVHVASLRHRLESHEWCYAAVRRLRGVPFDGIEMAAVCAMERAVLSCVTRQ